MFPPKIRIINRDYAIRQCESRDDVTPQGDANGLFYPDKGEIRIWMCSDQQQNAQVLLHEIIHAIMFAIGESELYNDEQFTERMAVALQCLLRDNDMSFINRES